MVCTAELCYAAPWVAVAAQSLEQGAAPAQQNIIMLLNNFNLCIKICNRWSHIPCNCQNGL